MAKSDRSVELIATRSFRYGTTRVTAGDTFRAAPADARLLIAIQKARTAQLRDPVTLPPPPNSLIEKVSGGAVRDGLTVLGDGAPEAQIPRPSLFDHDGDGGDGGSKRPDDDAEALAAARKDYQAALGKRPFPGWSVEVLREKIAAAGAGE